jgi:NAD(P)-dependent dehydrogenase (short-subunit alcohol dehydrogenase family)
MKTGLEGRVALVTGGGSGIGREAVLAFARAGSRIAVADLNTDSAKRAADEVTAAGGDAVAIEVDITSDPNPRVGVRHGS